MSRRTRTLIPTTAELLKPQVIEETERQQSRVQNQERYYNTGAKALPPLNVGDVVRMKPFELGNKKWKKAIVKERVGFRSYVIDANGQTYGRNRVDLRKTAETPDDSLSSCRNLYWPSSLTKNTDVVCKNRSTQSVVSQTGAEQYYRTRSGRQVKPPKRLDL